MLPGRRKRRVEVVGDAVGVVRLGLRVAPHHACAVVGAGPRERGHVVVDRAPGQGAVGVETRLEHHGGPALAAAVDVEAAAAADVHQLALRVEIAMGAEARMRLPSRAGGDHQHEETDQSERDPAGPDEQAVHERALSHGSPEALFAEGIPSPTRGALAQNSRETLRPMVRGWMRVNW